MIMTNKTTQQYQKGIDESMYESKLWIGLSECHTSEEIGRIRTAIVEYIKQHTLSILQSEYDRLEEEKMTMKNAIETHSNAGAGYTIGHNSAITDQQKHLLETINEIKGL